METFIASFLGSLIGTSFVTYLSSHFFYRLGRKHEREMNDYGYRK